ncbi:hypothetical protein IAD21_02016 [Abditibacteriota bacterium]|nr:hypothetical protein IAD21_02016 [Abditibacteriota bacterium]
MNARAKLLKGRNITASISMPQTVSIGDIARAAKVSQRAVQLHLERTRKRRPGEHWRFDLMDFPSLVNEVIATRKRRRENANTREVLSQ